MKLRNIEWKMDNKQFPGREKVSLLNSSDPLLLETSTTVKVNEFRWLLVTLPTSSGKSDERRLPLPELLRELPSEGVGDPWPGIESRFDLFGSGVRAFFLSDSGVSDLPLSVGLLLHDAIGYYEDKTTKGTMV
jgi:hypothetical protein